MWKEKFLTFSLGLWGKKKKYFSFCLTAPWAKVLTFFSKDKPCALFWALRPLRHEASMWVEWEGEEIFGRSELLLQLWPGKFAHWQAQGTRPGATLFTCWFSAPSLADLPRRSKLLASWCFDLASPLPRGPGQNSFSAGEQLECPPPTQMCQNHFPPASKSKVSVLYLLKEYICNIGNKRNCSLFKKKVEILPRI